MLQASTIFALSSGSVPAGVAVVRLSGAGVRTALARLAGDVPPVREMVLRSIRDLDGQLIDRGLVVFFEGPRSFTGDDSAEFHLHGSRAAVAALLGALGALPGFRQAEAGEFTRRAFVNGKLDLTGAEALSDLIQAETEQQRKLALQNADGRQAKLYAEWRTRLLRGRALIEAELDFSDESDVPGSVSDRVWADMGALRLEMQRHLEGFRAAEIVRDGFRVVIMGAPNVGKSSLLNCLAGRDVAIVTDEPGTTRDVIEVALDLGGTKVVLMDTAGVREGPGAVEAIGIERARAAAALADLVLLLEEPGAPLPAPDAPAEVDTLKVGTKSDLASGWRHGNAFDVLISSRTGSGIDKLLASIAARAAAKTVTASETAVPTRQRHVDLISAAMGGIDEALGDGPLELRVEGLRVAGDRIGRISGVIGTEEVLGEIFSTFCIGK